MTHEQPRPRTCSTCAHRSGSVKHGRCMLSGFYVEVERKHPTACGEDFAGWVQREPLLKRIRAWLYVESPQATEQPQDQK